ncbi:MAG: cytochrome c [Acidobacteria bacterium]|nr:cytochrome c [Acidobacteriota bacterium]
MKFKLSAFTKLTIASVPVILAAFVSFAVPKATMTPADYTPLAAGDAASNYAKYCNRCHGADGRSQTAKGRQTNAPDLTKSRISAAAGARLIASGKEQMPGFKNDMTPAEITALMGYVRGLR